MVSVGLEKRQKTVLLRCRPVPPPPPRALSLRAEARSCPRQQGHGTERQLSASPCVAPCKRPLPIPSLPATRPRALEGNINWVPAVALTTFHAAEPPMSYPWNWSLGGSIEKGEQETDPKEPREPPRAVDTQGVKREPKPRPPVRHHPCNSTQNAARKLAPLAWLPPAPGPQTGPRRDPRTGSGGPREGS